MVETLLGITILLLVLALALLILLAFGIRRANRDPSSMAVRELERTRAEIERLQDRTERTVKAEIETSRRQFAGDARASRDELAESIGRLSTGLEKQLGQMTIRTEERLEKIRETVYNRLVDLQAQNKAALNEMRQTVDEKLQDTLQKRLGESFQLISERLENVHRGLGEMQDLATGVGDLKRMLTNVKARGTWGEIQLGALLDQILAPDQFEKNVAVTGGSERVEFAIRMPGPDQLPASYVYLPIDSKFPLEDYQRLVDAHQQADVEGVQRAGKQLERQIGLSAQTIREKYIAPPHTTDFGIMFLPIEGLYAEVVQREGLTEKLQRDFRVVVAGPTTLTALLNSLQMGFRTLAIQERSSEVWQILGAVKSEFGKFGESLAKVQKKLQEASNSIERAETRTRAISRRLRSVEDYSESNREQLPRLAENED